MNGCANRRKEPFGGGKFGFDSLEIRGEHRDCGWAAPRALEQVGNQPGFRCMVKGREMEPELVRQLFNGDSTMSAASEWGGGSSWFTDLHER